MMKEVITRITEGEQHLREIKHDLGNRTTYEARTKSVIISSLPCSHASLTYSSHHGSGQYS